MGFAINSYQEDLRTKIKQAGNDIAKARNIDPNKSITGLKLTETQRKELSISVFNVTQNDQTTDAAGAQENKTQNKGAIAVSTFLDVIKNTANDAVKALTEVLNNLVAKLNESESEKSALSTPQTSGQTVNPGTNIPTNNSGTNSKAAQPKDSQRPNVEFGEDTGSVEENTGSVDNEQQESNVTEAQTSSDIDQAQIKKAQEETLEKAQQELENKANVFSQLLGA